MFTKISLEHKFSSFSCYLTNILAPFGVLLPPYEKEATILVYVIQVCIGLAMKNLRHDHLDLRIKSLIGDGAVKKRRSSSVTQGYLLALSSGE